MLVNLPTPLDATAPMPQAAPDLPARGDQPGHHSTVPGPVDEDPLTPASLVADGWDANAQRAIDHDRSRFTAWCPATGRRRSS